MKRSIIFSGMVLCLFFMFSATCFSQQEATETESPTASVAEAAEAPSVSIEEAVICRDVIDRAPVEPGDVFPVGLEKLFCFIRITGVQGEAEITHNWYYGENLVASVALPVRSVNWRTFSSKKIPAESTGEWRVEVVDGNGSILKKIIFLIQ